MTFLRKGPARGDDSGVAMMTTILIGIIIMGLGLVATNVSMSNLKNAGRDRVAGGAFGSAEAGIARAVAYIRANSVGELATNEWGSSTNPKQLTFADGGSAKVWIQAVQAFAPPSVKKGKYLIHSEGRSGEGPGLRRLTQSLTVEPFRFPMGVYAQEIKLNGTPQTFRQSVFSENCISGREKMVFSGTDAFYGIPSAANSAKWISTGNGGCSETNSRNIHRSGPCHPTYVHDRDAQGANPSGGTCQTSGTPDSSFDAAKLAAFGQQLPASVLGTLRAKAQAIGQYWESTTWTAPDPTVHPDAVIYFKLGANSTLNISTQLAGYNVDPATCTPKRSVIIVVENASVGTGGLDLQSNSNLMGGIFVPKGNFAYRGTSTFTGPINAHTIQQWNGTATSQLTACYLADLPGGLLDVRTEVFHEDDTS